MKYDDVYISLASALAEHENLTNYSDCTIFMSREFYEKACVLSREYIMQPPAAIITFCGRPVEIVDCPGEKLWIGRQYPIKEDV